MGESRGRTLSQALGSFKSGFGVEQRSKYLDFSGHEFIPIGICVMKLVVLLANITSLSNQTCTRTGVISYLKHYFP